MDDNYLIINNPDKKFRKELIEKLKANNGYCLSQTKRTPATLCPCKINNETGECLCGLFIKVPCVEVTEGG